MGLWHSRMTKFANYEKSLERVQGELQRSLAKRGNRQRRTAALGFWFAVGITIAVIIAAWQIYQVQQLPPRALSYQEHFRRVATAVALPCALGLLYWVALAAVGFLDGFDRRRVKHLEDTKRAMIKELKDMSNFEKTRAIIEKYDPDEAATRMQYAPPGMMVMQAGGRQGPGMYGTPPRQQGALVAYQQQQQPGNPLLRTPGHVANAAASAVAGAGKVLMPLLDSLATNLMSDNPALLEDLRRVQQQLQNAESQAEAAAQESNVLRSENAALRQRLAELGYPQQEDQEQQEQQGLLLEQGAEPPADVAGGTARDSASGASNHSDGSGSLGSLGSLAVDGVEYAIAPAVDAAGGRADRFGTNRSSSSISGEGQRPDDHEKAAEEPDGAGIRTSGIGEGGGSEDGATGSGQQHGGVRQRMHAPGGRTGMEQ